MFEKLFNFSFSNALGYWAPWTWPLAEKDQHKKRLKTGNYNSSGRLYTPIKAFSILRPTDYEQ